MIEKQLIKPMAMCEPHDLRLEMGQMGHGIPKPFMSGFFFSVMTNKCTKTHVELMENHESYITYIYI